MRAEHDDPHLLVLDGVEVCICVCPECFHVVKCLCARCGKHHPPTEQES